MTWTARLLEDLRQWVLVGELGQVTCDGSHEERTVVIDWTDGTPASSFKVRFAQCPDCGAAV